MPIQSQAQRRFLHARHPKVAEKFEEHTPPGAALPERAKTGRAELVRKLRARRAGRGG